MNKIGVRSGVKQAGLSERWAHLGKLRHHLLDAVRQLAIGTAAGPLDADLEALVHQAARALACHCIAVTLTSWIYSVPSWQTFPLRISSRRLAGVKLINVSRPGRG